MIRVTSRAKDGEDLSIEVDHSIAHFEKWFSRIQAESNEQSGQRVPTGLSLAERSIIKTYLGYYLGIGGHYTPPQEEETNAETNSR